MGLSRDAWVAVGWGLDMPQPNHRAIFRAKGKHELRKLLNEEPSDPTDTTTIEHTSGALPEWAEAPWWCDLPRCPVCALADRGYDETGV